MVTESLSKIYRERGWRPGVSLDRRYEAVVRDAPRRLAVADDRGQRLTRAELRAAATDRARELRARGIGERDVVLLIAPNRVEWVIVLVALFQLRAVPARAPVTADPPTIAYLVSVRATGASAGQAPPNVDHVMFTSSTTGRPTAVMHSADTLAALNLGFASQFGLGSSTPIFMPSALSHSIGSIHGARLAHYLGAPPVLQDRWDPERAICLVAEHRSAFTAAATPFLKDLVDTAGIGSTNRCAPSCAGARRSRRPWSSRPTSRCPACARRCCGR